MFRRFLVFCFKNRLFEKGMVAIPFFNFSSGGWWMLALDHVAKIYKTRFCYHPLLERRKRVKRKERPEENTKKALFVHFLGGLKNGQEVVLSVSNISCLEFAKAPVCKSFPGKVCNKQLLGEKAMLEKGPKNKD